MAFEGRCYPDELIEIARTGDPWLRRRGAGPLQARSGRVNDLGRCDGGLRWTRVRKRPDKS